MPHLPVIADVYRCTLNWKATNSQLQPRNVIHISSPTATDAADLVTRLDDGLAGLSFVWDPIPSDWAVEQISVLKLDGSSSTIDVDVPHPDRWIGGSSGEWSPNTAGVIKLQTGLRGREHRGRIFLGPCAENKMVDGKLNPTTVGDMAGDWGTWTNYIATHGAALGVASYRHASWSQATNVVVRARVGSMRRRLEALD